MLSRVSRWLHHHPARQSEVLSLIKARPISLTEEPIEQLGTRYQFCTNTRVLTYKYTDLMKLYNSTSKDILKCVVIVKL